MRWLFFLARFNNGKNVGKSFMGDFIKNCFLNVVMQICGSYPETKEGWKFADLFCELIRGDRYLLRDRIRFFLSLNL